MENQRGPGSGIVLRFAVFPFRNMGRFVAVVKWIDEALETLLQVGASRGKFNF
jgi:hypothetical protein